jgi:hypothetical protein
LIDKTGDIPAAKHLAKLREFDAASAWVVELQHLQKKSL